jgi:hypothetical protein
MVSLCFQSWRLSLQKIQEFLERNATVELVKVGKMLQQKVAQNFQVTGNRLKGDNNEVCS